jgi:ankyrin repeat protein
MNNKLDDYIKILRGKWYRLALLPKLSREEIKKISNQKIQVFFNCYYGYEDFFEYSDELLFNQYIGSDKVSLYLYACAGANIKIVQYLETKGYNINDTDTTKNNGYLYACEHGNLPIVKYFLSKGIDKNYKNLNGTNGYFFACSNNQLEILKYLESIGVDVHYRNLYGFDCLIMAVSYGHLNIVKYLIDKYNFILTSIYYYGSIKYYELYYRACESGQIKLAKYFEIKGIVNKNICDNGKKKYYIKQLKYKNYLCENF